MIEWLSREDFWREANPPANCAEDRQYHFQMPLQDIRARIQSMPPAFTPTDDGDFPGPVERWYGVIDGFRFILTYHYSAPSPHLVYVDYQADEVADRTIRTALEEWRTQSAYS